MRHSLAVLACVLLSSPIRAQTSDPPRIDESWEILKGVNAFYVNAGADSKLLDSPSLQTKAELKLRQNGIAVGSGTAILSIQCIALDDSDEPLIAFSCRADVRQLVTAQLPRLTALATIWTSGLGVASAGRNKYREAAEKNVEGLLDRFLNDWYKANPKK